MNQEKQKLKHSLIFPAFFVIIMWVIKFVEYSLNISFYAFGIYPLRLKNLAGILFSPFIHGDMEHLISNTFPVFLLSVTLFYFYRKYAYKIFLLIFFFTGLFVWLVAREAYHIGASGIIYGIAFFLIFSGLIAKNRALIAVSFIIIFLYGSLIWGVLPVDKNISWESHLFGAITGIILALGFSKYFYQTEEPEVKHKNYGEFKDFSISDDNIKEIEYTYKDDE